MVIYPGHVICSHIPYVHFGSGDLPIHVQILSFLRKPCSGQIEKHILAEHMSPNTHFSKNVSASGQMIPTPYGSILHPPRGSGHGCHVTGGGGRRGVTEVSAFVVAK